MDYQTVKEIYEGKMQDLWDILIEINKYLIRTYRPNEHIPTRDALKDLIIFINSHKQAPNVYNENYFSIENFVGLIIACKTKLEELLSHSIRISENSFTIERFDKKAEVAVKVIVISRLFNFLEIQYKGIIARNPEIDGELVKRLKDYIDYLSLIINQPFVSNHQEFFEKFQRCKQSLIGDEGLISGGYIPIGNDESKKLIFFVWFDSLSTEVMNHLQMTFEHLHATQPGEPALTISQISFEEKVMVAVENIFYSDKKESRPSFGMDPAEKSLRARFKFSTMTVEITNLTSPYYIDGVKSCGGLVLYGVKETNLMLALPHDWVYFNEPDKISSIIHGFNLGGNRRILQIMFRGFSRIPDRIIFNRAYRACILIKISEFHLKVLYYGYITLDGVEPVSPMPEEVGEYDEIKLIK